MSWGQHRSWKYAWGGVLVLCGVLLYYRQTKVPQVPVESPVSVLDGPRGPGFRFEYGEYCDMLVNSGGWLGVPFVSCDDTTRAVATCGEAMENNWQWASEAQRCGAQRLHPLDLQALLREQWVVIVGDSITRFFYAALLRALASHENQVVFGHQDFEYVLPGSIRASFLWAPYASNISRLFDSWGGERGESPDVVVASVGLWHMLHISDVDDYQVCLAELRESAQGFIQRQEEEGKLGPPLTFFSLTEVFPPKLKTAEKRQRLTLKSVDLYNQALLESELIVPTGPFYLLDMHHLTAGCGGPCTHDGLHYNNATYDAAVQVWANNLHMLGAATHT